jgi:hypothetical protein
MRKVLSKFKDKNSINFIEEVIATCKLYGVRCSIRDVSYVKLGGFKCGGWFDGEDRELVCSMKHDKGLALLAHEFSHFHQWAENSDIWDLASRKNSHSAMHEWIEGKQIRDIKKHIAICRDLEVDAEKRAVKMIKKYNLPIDIDEYIRGANAYIYFYNYILNIRRWSTPKNSPYRNKILIASMPKTFMKDYSVLPDRLLKVYQEQGI